MPRAYRVNRDITKKECPWLDNTIEKTSLVWEYTGHTYGCISSTGTAVTLEMNTTPFFELPTNCLEFDLHCSD